jgi:predicted nucleic acid-binding protein
VAKDAFLVDTNVLIRWVQRQDAAYQVVSEAIRQLLQSNVSVHYTSQNLGQFWNTLTRPTARNGYGLTPAQADELAVEIELKLTLLPDGIHVHQEWRRLLVDYGVSGVQVHDARLVAAMRVHGVRRILTFNAQDFRRYTDIEAVLPQSVTATG